jgi:hypothetical protein
VHAHDSSTQRPSIKRGLQASLLLLSLATAPFANAGVVDDMILAGVPHTEWYLFDSADIGVNLVRNPGQWSQPVRIGNSTTTVWEGADASGLGATITPYTAMSYWYQRNIDCIDPTGRGCSSRTSLYPNLDGNGWSKSLLAIAADVPMPNLGLSVSAYAAKTLSNAWIYRYTFSNVSNQAQTFEFMLSEFDNHEGLHHEFNFYNANGTQAYDEQPFSAIIDPHNYDWTHLMLDPGTSLVVGFSDVNAPAMETWGVRTADGIHAEAWLKLPVPAVPEPSTWALMMVSLLALVYKARTPRQKQTRVLRPTAQSDRGATAP